MGASFAAFSDGVPIVDIWGGTADSGNGAVWSADTMQIVFSGTKGLVATCLLLLINRELLNLRPQLAVLAGVRCAGKGGSQGSRDRLARRSHPRLDRPGYLGGGN